MSNNIGNKKTLYEISDDLSIIYNVIENSEGEIPTDIEEILDSLELSFDEKTENIGKMMLDLSAQEKMFDVEISRLNLRKKTIKNAHTRLKEYVKQSMETTGKSKLPFDLFTFAIQKSPPSLKVEDEEVIPDKFFIMEKRIDRTDLLRVLKSGDEVPGCSIDKSKTHLRLR